MIRELDMLVMRRQQATRQHSTNANTKAADPRSNTTMDFPIIDPNTVNAILCNPIWTAAAKKLNKQAKPSEVEHAARLGFSSS